MPGPVRVCPFRSSTTLSTWMTNASPGQVRSFARTKLALSCMLQVASRAGMVSDGAALVLGPTLAEVTAVDADEAAAVGVAVAGKGPGALT